jgi:hypothetical protein
MVSKSRMLAKGVSSVNGKSVLRLHNGGNELQQMGTPQLNGGFGGSQPDPHHIDNRAFIWTLSGIGNLQ